MREDLPTIVAAYHIEPEYIKQITPLLYYIDDGDQTYALKKSKLDKESIRMWMWTYDQAYQHQLSFIPSVILTRDSQLFVMHNDYIYYMTHWIEHKDYSIHHIFRALGRLHAKTKQTTTIQVNELANRFTSYKEKCQHMFHMIIKTVEKFERELYMSPFELQVCTHFRHIERVIQTLTFTINRFLDECQTQTEWNYSLCHGNFHMSHIVASDQTYFINWEKTHFNHAILDLITFFKQSERFSFPRQSCMSSFPVYLEENGLTPSEHLLLCIYLLDPSFYLTIIQHYNHKDNERTMIDDVMTLEQAYRQLKFGLQWVDHYEQELEALLFDEKDD